MGEGNNILIKILLIIVIIVLVIFGISFFMSGSNNGKNGNNVNNTNLTESQLDSNVNVANTNKENDVIKSGVNNPYIPEGFEHISGEVDEGYIIQDKYGNQYVWVPVKTGILTRTTSNNKEYEETSPSATGLVNSVAKNYGFYIARFEASAYEANGVKFACTVDGQKPWTNINYQDAVTASEKTARILEYPEEFDTALISSYAWDTVLSFIDKSITNYSTNTSYGNYSGTVLPTGSTDSDRVKNICDLAGNVREWTTEIYKESSEQSNDNEKNANRVVRGGSAYINKVANSRNGYPEDLTDEYWGFRIILYKNN